MFDWLSGTCLWSLNDAALKRYNYPVNLEELPISSGLLGRLRALVEEHDEALNWDDLGSGLVWDKRQVRAFDEKATSLYHELCGGLGDDYKIELLGGSLV